VEPWSLGASPPRGHTRPARNDYSASLLSGYGRQLGRRSAGEYLSGRAIVKLLPHMEQLNPLIRACGDDPAAGRTLVDVFSGNPLPMPCSSIRRPSPAPFGRSSFARDREARRVLYTPRK
jgi:hypothetical protein